MKKLLILIGCLLFNCSITVSAQTEDKPVKPVTVRDTSVKNAPYSAEATSEVIRTLPDGNRIKNGDKQLLFRDRQGRTRRESESVFANTTRKTIYINDPVAGFNYYVNHVKKIVIRAPNVNLAGRVASASSPNGYSGKSESLGTKTIEGIEATGTRSIITVAPGTVGNEKPIETISESWFSPELKLIILSKRSDPQTGDYTFQLKNIKRGEPEASLFEVPSDYKIIEGGNISDRFFTVSAP